MEQRKSTKDGKGKTQEGQTPSRLNTDVLVDGGSNRSSVEDLVMGLEQRVGIIQLERIPPSHPTLPSYLS